MGWTWSGFCGVAGLHDAVAEGGAALHRDASASQDSGGGVGRVCCCENLLQLVWGAGHSGGGAHPPSHGLPGVSAQVAVVCVWHLRKDCPFARLPKDVLKIVLSWMDCGPPKSSSMVESPIN